VDPVRKEQIGRELEQVGERCGWKGEGICEAGLDNSEGGQVWKQQVRANDLMVLIEDGGGITLDANNGVDEVGVVPFGFTWSRGGDWAHSGLDIDKNVFSF